MFVYLCLPFFQSFFPRTRAPKWTESNTHTQESRAGSLVRSFARPYCAPLSRAYKERVRANNPVRGTLRTAHLALAWAWPGTLTALVAGERFLARVASDVDLEGGI